MVYISSRSRPYDLTTLRSYDLTILRQVLDVTANNFDCLLPAELGDLRRIEVLRLADNHFRGAVPLTLANLKQCKELTLHLNRLGGVGPGTKLPFHIVGMRATLTACNISDNCWGEAERGEIEAYLRPRLTGASSNLEI